MKASYKIIFGSIFCVILACLVFFVPSVLAQQSLGQFFDTFFPTRPPASYVDFGDGEQGLLQIIIYYANIFKRVVAILSVLFIVIAGIRMTTASGNEEIAVKNRKAVTWLLFGLILMQIAESFVSILYGDGRKNLLDFGQDVPTDLRVKLLEPLIGYFLTFLAAIGVFMVVLSGLRMISAGGDEGKIKKQQQVLFWAVLGLIVILVARPLVAGIYGYTSLNPQPTQVISLIVQIANYMLGFVSIIAVVVLIYAGALMVANFGNDQLVAKARKIITWTLVGIALLISAYTLVVFFIAPTTG